MTPETPRALLFAACMIAAQLSISGKARAVEFEQATSSPRGKSIWNSEPAWSPDGMRIAYTHAELDPSNQFTSWIEVIPAAGGKPERLPGQETDEKPLLNSHASWSPDGARLVFASHSGLYISSKEGRHPARLLPGLHQEGAPAWSPENSWIAFESDVAGIRTVCRIPPPGGTVDPFPTGRGPLSTPAWSSDGTHLACAVSSGRGRDLWILPIPGGVWRAVTQGDSDDASPAWSPDGSMLVFVSNRSGNRDLWIVSVQGGDPVQLTEDPGDDLDPSWSPDGKRIAFASSRSGTLHVWIASDLPPVTVLQRSWEPRKSLRR